MPIFQGLHVTLEEAVDSRAKTFVILVPFWVSASLSLFHNTYARSAMSYTPYKYTVSLSSYHTYATLTPTLLSSTLPPTILPTSSLHLAASFLTANVISAKKITTLSKGRILSLQPCLYALLSTLLL